MIKAVGLDLDDTIYDRNQVYEKAYAIMERNILSTKTSFKEFNQVFQRKSLIEFQNFVKGIKGELDYKTDRIIDTYKELEWELSNEQALIFNSVCLHFRDQIQIRPGMKKLIDYLQSVNVQLFILTNGPEKTQLKKLHNLGIDKYIQHDSFFISEKLGVAKPNKKIFDVIEDRLKLNGNEILYIGDHYESDVRSSLKNDWKAIFYNVNNMKIQDENVLQFFSDEQVYEYVKGLFT